MFQDRFPFDEDFETVVVIVELIYPMVFHLIFPSMDLNMREGCGSLSLYRVARVPLWNFKKLNY